MKKVTKAKINNAIKDWFYDQNIAGNFYKIYGTTLPHKGQSGYVSGSVAIEFVHVLSEETQQDILDNMKYILGLLDFRVRWAEFVKSDNTIYITFV